MVVAHAERLKDDHQYLIGAGADALHASPTQLDEAWLYLVERAHEGDR